MHYQFRNIKETLGDKLPLQQVHQYPHLQGLVCHSLLHHAGNWCEKCPPVYSYCIDKVLGMGETGPKIGHASCFGKWVEGEEVALDGMEELELSISSPRHNQLE